MRVVGVGLDIVEQLAFLGNYVFQIDGSIDIGTVADVVGGRAAILVGHAQLFDRLTGRRSPGDVCLDCSALLRHGLTRRLWCGGFTDELHRKRVFGPALIVGPNIEAERCGEAGPVGLTG